MTAETVKMFAEFQRQNCVKKKRQSNSLSLSKFLHSIFFSNLVPKSNAYELPISPLKIPLSAIYCQHTSTQITDEQVHVSVCLQSNNTRWVRTTSKYGPRIDQKCNTAVSKCLDSRFSHTIIAILCKIRIHLFKMRRDRHMPQTASMFRLWTMDCINSYNGLQRHNERLRNRLGSRQGSMFQDDATENTIISEKILCGYAFSK